MSSEDRISEADEKRVDEAKDRLLEHFDSVRIFVTKHNGPEDSTGAYTAGGGNVYAQQGHVAEWIERMHMRADEEELGDE